MGARLGDMRRKAEGDSQLQHEHNLASALEHLPELHNAVVVGHRLQNFHLALDVPAEDATPGVRVAALN
jgi:hypothetical protein